MKQPGLKYFAILLLYFGLLAITANQGMAVERLENREYSLKAAFIYNFIKFTRWPAADTADKPLLLSVAGTNPFGDALLPLTQKQVSGRSIVLTKAIADSDWHDAALHPPSHILFVAFQDPELFSPVIAAVAGKPILTISDAKGFARRGGCIELRQQQGKIRFILNRQAIQQQGLELSYKVYDLALEIVGE
ncbi:MAG: YfiR family protein [Desulfuromonadales bacterium]|nr:YfiR family protein [Desulfuromonadales bacterium]